jgi:hypothetical protein
MTSSEENSLQISSRLILFHGQINMGRLPDGSSIETAKS